jgi:hypothetical protein
VDEPDAGRPGTPCREEASKQMNATTRESLIREVAPEVAPLIAPLLGRRMSPYSFSFSEKSPERPKFSRGKTLTVKKKGGVFILIGSGANNSRINNIAGLACPKTGAISGATCGAISSSLRGDSRRPGVLLVREGLGEQPAQVCASLDPGNKLRPHPVHPDEVASGQLTTDKPPIPEAQPGQTLSDPSHCGQQIFGGNGAERQLVGRSDVSLAGHRGHECSVSRDQHGCQR